MAIVSGSRIADGHLCSRNLSGLVRLEHTAKHGQREVEVSQGYEGIARDLVEALNDKVGPDAVPSPGKKASTNKEHLTMPTLSENHGSMLAAGLVQGPRVIRNVGLPGPRENREGFRSIQPNGSVGPGKLVVDASVVAIGNELPDCGLERISRIGGRHGLNAANGYSPAGQLGRETSPPLNDDDHR